MVITKESALVIAFLFSMTAWVVPVFAVSQEIPNNTFNFTSVAPNFDEFLDAQPLSCDLNYFENTAFGKSFDIPNSTDSERYIVIKIPIQNTSSTKLLNLTLGDVGAGTESSVLLGFSNNTFPDGQGASVGVFQGACDGQPTFCSYEVLGGNFTRFSVNISETELGLSVPENTVDTIFFGFPNSNQLIDDINLTEDGAITFTEDFETNTFQTCPDQPSGIITGAFAGITSSIIEIIGLIIISGVAILSVIAFARKGTARIDEVIRLVLILIVAIAFVGAIVSLA